MKGHGQPPPIRELYPSLMQLPELTSERRDAIRSQARARMTEGLALWKEGLALLEPALAQEDYVATQGASAKIREGQARFESGVAALLALSEGRSPRAFALEWFKDEMDLRTPAAHRASAGSLIGFSWFHVFVMAALGFFAVVMVGMYFFKMRRAAALVETLTGGAAAASVPAAAIPQPGASSGPRAASLPSEKPGRWSGRLRVAQVFQETPSVKTFRLMNPLGGVLPFAYLPGQFLTVTIPFDGRPVRRAYTIASSPTRGDYAEITVKHEEGGVVSGYLHDRLREGDLLDASGPSGSFVFTGRECKCVLLVGGGVGITPLMSVLRYLTDRSWPGDIYLIYGCRAPEDIIYREELDYLARRHANLRVTLVVSRPEGTDWKGATGRITKELIAATVPDLASRYVHICGPVPMMEALKRSLAELGVPAERVRTEAFGPALGRPEPERDAAAGATAAQAAKDLPKVSFSLSEKSSALPPDKTVLEVADQLGVDIDNSCRVGTCGTCRVRLLRGQVTMAVEDGLEPGDKEKGIILACQAKSIGDIEVEA